MSGLPPGCLSSCLLYTPLPFCVKIAGRNLNGFWMLTGTHRCMLPAFFAGETYLTLSETYSHKVSACLVQPKCFPSQPKSEDQHQEAGMYSLFAR